MLNIVGDSYQLTTDSQPDGNRTTYPSGIILPLVDKTSYDVPLEKIGQWEKAFPAVDVRQELHKMAAWLDATPTRRKTRRGICRFINSWLSREQDKGGTYRNSSRNGQQDISPEQRARQEENERFYDEMYSKYLTSPLSPDAPFQ